jgi:hypothetical protein
MPRRARRLLTAEDEAFFASFKPVPLPGRTRVGFQVDDRVFIVGRSHPACGSAGVVREVMQVKQFFGGGTGYAVEVDGMAGHRVGCRADELQLAPAPRAERGKGRRR